MNNQKLPFDYVKNAFDTETHTLTAVQLKFLCGSMLIKTDIANLRRGNQSAKKYLPAVCWAAHFSDGRRHEQTAESSGYFCQDIDHIGDARQYYAEHFAGREDELGIVFAHVSPSGDGLHIVACLHSAGSLAQNQAWLAATTKSVYDPVCKDMPRMFYLSSEDDIIYNDIY